MTYHGPLYGKIIGKYIELKYHSEDVDKLEADLKSQRQLAGELVASIRVNFKTGRFTDITEDQLEMWLRHFTSRLLPYEAPPAREE